MHITEIVLPVKELHAKAKEYGVSITILITAMFLCSIHEEIPKSRQNRPIALMVPVNLQELFSLTVYGKFFWLDRSGNMIFPKLLILQKFWLT